MADKVTLADCPIGLFMDGGELCLKTEYTTDKGKIEAYIVSSGEFYSGGDGSAESQRSQMVTPVENVILQKRPVAFRIQERDNWIILQNEEAAQIEAEHRGVEYQGLYVREDVSK